jgi:hypothetical protein
MYRYYVFRLGSSFKILYMDVTTAELWTKAGWELRSYESNEEAQVAMSKWEADIQKRLRAKKQSA